MFGSGLCRYVTLTASKNKDVFTQRFRELVEQIESELKVSVNAGDEAPVSALTGK